MALVNIAVDLARRGRRVLAVDFDLEAPGLDTFDLPRPTGLTSGVVDFVSEYLDTGQAPEAARFVYESPGIGDKGGGLWIMPSGAHQRIYARLFTKIDWRVLYERHDAFLLFEDLKAQWKEFIKPDYVLIDSRTGHTDVGGICTRQFPDAVAVLFFPNSQNLRGLTRVVRDIRDEGDKPHNEPIKLHFIMSNVPDLDDEDNILQENIASFEQNLGFKDPMVIHHYDSLSLLNQVIFTKDRPRSRLAKEYRSITSKIILHNADDREGVIQFLDSIEPERHHWRSHKGLIWPRKERNQHFDRIKDRHRGDGEILFRLACFNEYDGHPEEAIRLSGKAIEAGYREPEAYLTRANIRRRELGDRKGASQDATNVLRAQNASIQQLLRALRIVEPEHLQQIDNFPALNAQPPEEQIRFARQLNRTKREAQIARKLLRPLCTECRQVVGEYKTQTRQALILACIALGDFSQAIRVTLSEEPNISKMDIAFAFNYGMALWGDRGEITPEPFERVVECIRSESTEEYSPSRLQCFAVANWAIGEWSRARRFVEQARQENQIQQIGDFSCWRFLRVPSKIFDADLQEILILIEGDQKILPRFFS